MNHLAFVVLLRQALSFSLTETKKKNLMSLEAVNGLCGDPKEIKNSQYQIVDRPAMIVHYKCDAGFVVRLASTEDLSNKLVAKESLNVTCSASSLIWSPIFSCVPRTCTKPIKPVAHATLVNWAKNISSATVDYGVNATFACDKGYTSDGLVKGPSWVSQLCIGQDTWIPIRDSYVECKRISCGFAPRALNADLAGSYDFSTKYLFADVIPYKCLDSRYSLSGGKNVFSLTCDESGQFVPLPLPSCELKNCGTPPLFQFATPAALQDVLVNEKVLYSCDSGYQFALPGNLGTAKGFDIRCEDTSGSTSFVLPADNLPCKPVPCGETPKYENARWLNMQEDQSTSSFHYGDITKWQCMPGYALSGIKEDTTFFASCDTSGVWSPSTPRKCDPLVCDLKSMPADIVRYGKLLPYTSTSLRFGNNVPAVVECLDKSVSIVNSSKSSFGVICDEFGNFKSSSLCGYPCKLEDLLPAISYASANVTVGSVLPVFGGVGGSVGVTCTNGYMVKDFPGVLSQEVSCNRDGSFSNMLPCEIIVCQRPPLALGKAVRYDDVPTKTIPWKSRVTYKCPYGLSVQGTNSTSFQVTCDIAGVFTGKQDCVDVNCFSPPKLNNSVIEGNVYKKYSFEDKVRYKCKEGYESNEGSQPEALCSGDSSWVVSGKCMRERKGPEINVGSPSGVEGLSSSASLQSQKTSGLKLFSYFLISFLVFVSIFALVFLYKNFRN